MSAMYTKFNSCALYFPVPNSALCPCHAPARSESTAEPVSRSPAQPADINSSRQGSLKKVSTQYIYVYIYSSRITYLSMSAFYLCCVADLCTCIAMLCCRLVYMYSYAVLQTCVHV